MAPSDKSNDREYQASLIRSASTMKRTTFIHIHTPKTAGWMFWNILKSNFGPDLKADYPSPSYHVFPQEALEWALRQYRYTCYTSHNYRLSSIPEQKDHKIVVISFARDPVRKFLSYYFYCRERPETGPWHPTKTLRLPEFLEELLSTPEFCALPLDTSQSGFLRGNMPPAAPETIVERGFGPVHVFPTERFDDALICLERLYPEQFRDCSYAARANQSVRDQSVTAADYQKIESLPWIGDDRELHRFSFKYLDALLAEVFPDSGCLQSARDDFNYRCAKRKAADAGHGSAAGHHRMPLRRRIAAAARMLVKGR